MSGYLYQLADKSYQYDNNLYSAVGSAAALFIDKGHLGSSVTVLTVEKKLLLSRMEMTEHFIFHSNRNLKSIHGADWPHSYTW